MKHYVVGFLFRPSQVALIRKQTPIWQRNKLNGIGGKIEGNETPKEAMIREFHEEAGTIITNWQEFLVFEGSDFRVHCFTANGDAYLTSRTSEPVAWYPLYSLGKYELVHHLNWLIPLARDSVIRGYKLTYIPEVLAKEES